MSKTQALDPIRDLVVVVVSGGYDAAATSVTLQSGEGSELPITATEGEFRLVWWNSTDYSTPEFDPQHEIIVVPSRASDVISGILRGQDGTTATTKNTAGKTYSMVLSLTRAHIETLRDGITDHVKRFGAVGNDVANDTQAFKDAIASLEARRDAGTINGACLGIPGGTYRLDDTILTDLQRFRLCGIGTGASKLKWIGSNAIPMLRFVPASGAFTWLTIENLELLGVKNAASSGDAIEIEDPFHVELNRVDISKFGGIGCNAFIAAGALGNKIKLSSCSIRECLGGGVRIADNAAATQSAGQVMIEHCIISQNDVVGIYLDKVLNASVVATELNSYGLAKNTALHLAHPVVINGGSTISLINCTMGDNAGDASNQTKLIRVGRNRAGADTTNLTTSLLVQACHFKPNTHTTCIELGRVQACNILANLFEFGGAGRDGIEFLATLLQGARVIRSGNHWASDFPAADREVGSTPPMGLNYDGRVDSGTTEYFHPELITENSAPEQGGHVYRGFTVRRRGDTHPSAMLTSRRLLMDTGSVDPDVAPGMVGLEFGTGAPEGALARPRGFLFMDTATGQLWVKKTIPTTSTGWEAVTSA